MSIPGILACPILEWSICNESVCISLFTFPFFICISSVSPLFIPCMSAICIPYSSFILKRSSFLGLNFKAWAPIFISILAIFCIIPILSGLGIKSAGSTSPFPRNAEAVPDPSWAVIRNSAFPSVGMVSIKS